MHFNRIVLVVDIKEHYSNIRGYLINISLFNMLEPWNDARILPPPVYTFKCDFVLGVKQLRYTCNSIINVLSKQLPLHREAAICSRFLYKFDKKFRNDIGYRNFKKVNTALRKYLAINLFKIVENFLLLLPSGDDDLYLPTRQMLEYVLLRLMAFSKVMIRICICSKQAAVFYFDRVKRGESHWMSLMPYALLCRIWSTSIVLIQHACSWYSSFYPFLEKLQLKGMQLLHSGYKFPSNIRSWLDIDNLDNFGRFHWAQKKQAQFEQLLVEDEEGDILGNILEFVSQINEVKPGEKLEQPGIKPSVQENINAIKELPVSNNVLDQGEKISRDIFKSFYREAPAQKIQHSAERVTNREALQQFIPLEEKYRNEGSKLSLTSHLSFMQWQALKISLEALLESLAKNRKIEKKFQNLWKEKCLDYK